MGRSGIDIREKSIRVTFTFNGKQERPTLMMNGVPMAPTPANIKYAERLSAEIKEKIRLSLFSMAEYFPASGNTQEVTTVGMQLDTWLAAQRIEASTRAGYSSGVKFWKEQKVDEMPIGDRGLRSLKPSHILTAIANRPDLSGKTINNYVQVLREGMELARRDRDIAVNPAAEIKPAKHQKAIPDPFSKVEADRITADILANQPEQVGNFVEFWMWTGMRTSEIFGLRWENVDLASGSVLVAEAVVRGVKKDNTKTNTARTVKLNSIALGALQRQRTFTQMVGESVFLDPRYGTSWVDERAFRRSYWTPTLKRLGIRYRRPYNMRHTYATIMLMASMNHAFCAKQLGHSIEMFQRTYSKWIDGEQNDREMDRLEATLSPAYPQKQKKAS
jgi:integrase